MTFFQPRKLKNMLLYFFLFGEKWQNKNNVQTELVYLHSIPNRLFIVEK
jgi:hypothetical protein